MFWVFIGAGNMASSLIGGLLASEQLAQHVAVVDPNSEACDRAKERFGIHAAGSLAELATIIADQPVGFVIAVKPQVVESACRAVSDFLSSRGSANASSAVVVSVAAGVRASSMEHWLPANTALIRCMPNTPALLGLGATGLYANPACSQTHKDQAKQLLDAAGMSLWVEEESLLDAVTAVSGSGPAYFFYLIEQMTLSAVQLGLDETTARELAIETAFGAASMARHREHAPAQLRENVTSKGGTTAAALHVFNEQNVPAIVAQAMQAAHDRAAAMGDEFAAE